MSGDARLESLRSLIEAAERAAAAAPARPEQRTREPLDAAGRAALQQALRLLAVRGYATEELRRRLLRQHEAMAVDAALASLGGTSFLDDRAWATAYVGGMRGRERSAALLRRDLASKGVGVEDVGAALEAHDDDAAALAAARRRVGALRRLEPAVRQRRLRDYLVRRGFSTATALRAMASVLDEASEG